jgi:hypothetical protein
MGQFSMGGRARENDASHRLGALPLHLSQRALSIPLPHCSSPIESVNSLSDRVNLF